MTEKPKLARLAPALLYAWYGTALLSMPAGLLLAVAAGWAGSWPMLGASSVLFLYAAFAVRLLVSMASQKGIGEALGRGASMLAAMQSRGN